MKVGRNAPCPCGSGKKHKKCCLVRERNAENAERRLMARIMEFTDDARLDKEIKDAFDLFWDAEREPEPAEVAGFRDWFTYDYELSSGATPIELFYEEKAEQLPALEREILAGWLDANLGVYEVQNIEKGRGVLVKDLFLGGKYFVHDVSTSKAVSKWDLLIARILPVKEKHRFSGAAQVCGQNMKRRLLNYLNEEWKAYQHDFPGATKKEFLKAEGYIFNVFALDLEEMGLGGIRLTTVEGDEMVFCTAVFEVNDFGKAVERMKGFEDFHREEDSAEELRYGWVEAGRSVNFTADRAKLNQTLPPVESPGFRLLGNITLSSRELILDCTSKERLEAGKKLLIERLGDAIEYKFGTAQEVGDALKGRGEVEEELPSDIQNEFVSTFMEEYYTDWIDMPVPALNGMTPREASKTEEGRRRLEELLKGLENLEERKKRMGNYGYDVSKIRRELNIWPR